MTCCVYTYLEINNRLKVEWRQEVYTDCLFENMLLCVDKYWMKFIYCDIKTGDLSLWKPFL